ncbi:YHS domain-containing (seleno)protein [uncultured Rubinisphaera sp.]|uniref:YHS domain-containing (seleno)protein n=1 Tax=uncultured Rubinisphaera sp. TaxID=1678686 RepID=UPI0030DC39C1|tara:strand:- start:485 stop:865 length:381 start_codon:yes stop_codon:yes gene_type:complete
MNEQHTPELNGFCPVAYFAVGEPMQGHSEFSSTYQGKLYHFVNAEVKQEFDRNPEKYIPAYGGRCAFGMSIDKEFEPDPTNFKIIDGKLYLFLKNDETDALELWNKEDEAKCLANANKHWQSKTTA